MKVDFEKLGLPSTFQDQSFDSSVDTVQLHNNFSSRKIDQTKDSIQLSKAIPIQVRHPYYISKSLSPNHYDREINYLERKNILPKATLRFIRNEVTKQVEESSINNYDNPEEYIRQEQKHDSTTNNEEEYHSTVQQKSIRPKGSMVTKIKQEILIQELKSDKIIKNIHTGKSHVPLEQSWKLQQDSQFKASSFKPTILTKDSQISKKVEKERKSKKTGLHFNLYNDAIRYEVKRSIEKEVRQFKHQEKFRKEPVRYSKYSQHYVPFYKRLEKEVEKYGYRKRLWKKYENTDPTTGRQLFRPDQNESRNSYQTLFLPAVEKYKKQKTILQATKSELQIIKFQEQSSEKQFKTVKTTTRWKRSSENEQTLTPIKSILEKTQGILANREQLVMEHIADSFYPKDNTKEILQHKDSGSLNEQQYRVLQPFLTSFESNPGKNRQMFLVLLRKFYQKLNLYDQQTLRDPVLEENRIRNRTIKLTNLQHTHSPIINMRSRSLEQLSQRYEQLRYYF